MPEYYIAKRGYQLKCDRPLNRGRGVRVKMAVFSLPTFE